MSDIFHRLARSRKVFLVSVALACSSGPAAGIAFAVGILSGLCGPCDIPAWTDITFVIAAPIFLLTATIALAGTAARRREQRAGLSHRPWIRETVLIGLAAPVLVIGILVLVGANAWRAQADRVCRRIDRTFDEIRLPPTYVLVDKQASGCLLPSLFGQSPSQARSYHLAPAGKEPDSLLSTLRREGWRAGAFRPCFVSAKRAGYELWASFRPTRKIKGGGPPGESFCPKPAWRATYLSIYLDLQST